AENGGKAAWRDMAVSHASKTLADMVRADGSTYHVVDYSTAGALLHRGTLQGYSDSSTWTRGQAWAIYGYAMVYRYTSDARMLAAARKVADYYLSRLGNEAVPNWDFDAPTQHKDSSAAAAVASALIELSGVLDLPDRDRYLQAAKRMLDELASPAYLAAGTPTRPSCCTGWATFPKARPSMPASSTATTTSSSSPASSGGCASGSDAAIGALALLTCAPLRRRLRRKPSTVVEKRDRS